MGLEHFFSLDRVIRDILRAVYARATFHVRKRGIEMRFPVRRKWGIK
jgi:hypothetical protein